MDLSIIIINWNTKAYVKACVESILRETEGIQYEVLVADNASHDGCDEMLKSEFPWVRFIQAPGNLGFARANNLAAREAKGAALLFLNPDTVILDRSIVKLVECLNTLHNPGALGARLLNSDLTFQTSCIKSYPTIINQLLTSEALQRRFPMWKLWGMADGFRSSREPAKVEVISGACILVKRPVFDKIGGFNEKYFMYSEDVDFCLACTRAGTQNYYIPTATIIHHGGAGSSQVAASDFSTLMFMESRYRYFDCNKGILYAQAYRLCTTIAGIARLTVIAVGLALRWKPVARNQLFISRKKWLAIVGWSLGWKQVHQTA